MSTPDFIKRPVAGPPKLPLPAGSTQPTPKSEQPTVPFVVPSKPATAPTTVLPSAAKPVAPAVVTTVKTTKQDSLFAKRAPKRINFTPILLVLLVLVAAVAGWLLYEKLTTETKIEKQASTISALEKQISELEEDNQSLINQAGALQAEIDTKNSLLEAREGFVTSLKTVNQLVDEADEFIDVSANVKAITEARNAVYEERENAENIEAQQKLVEAEAVKVQTAYDEWKKEEEKRKAEEAKKAELRKNTSGTVAEQALDDITEGTIAMTIVDEPCGKTSEEATACVSSDQPKTVQVATVHASNPDFKYDDWRMVMTHEYAHVIQFANYDKLTASNGYKNVFNRDLEWYADCMARAVVGEDYRSGYDYECSPEQLEIGNQAWDAKFL